MKSAVMAEPALVGRENELSELIQSLDETLSKKGKTVFISGEAGSGKTRLVNEFLKTAKEKGISTLTGSCQSNAAVPYLPFTEAFSTYLAQKGDLQSDEADEVAAWLTGKIQAEETGKYGQLGPTAWKDLTFAAVASKLSAMASAEALIFLIEDLHWADSASLSLLHYISRTLKSQKILLLATYRAEELITDSEGQVHPLADELHMMQREGLITEVQLGNLDPKDVTKIASNMMGGTVGQDFASKLSEESRGNALFLVESLRMLSERGGLYEEDGEWHLQAETLAIPKKFKDVILRRFSLLKFDQRRVLDAASVIGEKFDAGLLSAVLDQDILDVLERLNAISRSTSLVAVEEEFFKFDHAKSRQAIYEEIAVPLKKGYHKRVAEKLMTNAVDSGEKPPFSQIAYHYAEAGNTEKAVTYSMAAGEDALARFSNVEAIKHFVYVLQNDPDLSTKPELKSKALEGLGEAYYANGKYNKAAETFENLASVATGKMRLRAFRKAMDGIYFGNPPGKRDHVIELAKQAEPYFDDDRLEAARIRMVKSPLEAEKMKELDAALQIFEEEFSLPDISRALSIRVYYEQKSSVKQALSDSARALALQKEFYGDSVQLARAAGTKWQVFLQAGLLREAMEDFAEALKIDEKLGNYHNEGEAYVSMSRVLEVFGRTEEALAASLKAVSALEKTDGVRRQDRICADLARLYAKLGDLVQAEEYINQLNSQVPTIMVGDPLGLLNKRDKVRSQAVFFAATSRWKEAYQLLEEALEIAKNVPMYPMYSQVTVRNDYAWVLKKQGRTEEANAHLEEIQRLNDEVNVRFSTLEIEANLLAPRNVTVGQEFEMRFDVFNVSRKTGFLAKAEKLVPLEFDFVNSPTAHTAQSGSVDMKKEKISPFEVKTIKLRTKASQPGRFNVNPELSYINESGEPQSRRSNSVTITVKPAPPKFETLPGRITTGFEDLDALLLGGLPEKHAIALVGPSVEERELIARKFLSSGAKSGETTFIVTTEPGLIKKLSEEYPSNFFLFVCNLQADSPPSSPNVIALKGIENLNAIDIELVKAIRTLKTVDPHPRRICLNIVSDALLQHHAVTTRRWLSVLLPMLKTKGFTILSVIDSQMHPVEELQAVLALFDGELRILERETAKGSERTLTIRRLYNQKYIEKDLLLTKERLQK